MQRTESRSTVAVRVYEEIVREGGRTVKEVAATLNLNPRFVNEALLSLEADGLLLYEDDEGRLYPYDKDSK